MPETFFMGGCITTAEHLPLIPFVCFAIVLFCLLFGGAAMDRPWASSIKTN